MHLLNGSGGFRRSTVDCRRCYRRHSQAMSLTRRDSHPGRAKAEQNAIVAMRFGGETHSAAVADQQEMEVEHEAGRDEAGKVVMSLLGRRASDQTQSPTDAMDVRVHRQHRLTAGEEQHACGCLRAHALEFPQVVPRGLIGQVSQEVERQAASLAVNLVEDGFDSRCLLSRQPSLTDGVDDLRD